MKQLRLDPIECDGHGLCAELFPEWIQSDDLGYPIIDDRPIPSNLLSVFEVGDERLQLRAGDDPAPVRHAHDRRLADHAAAANDSQDLRVGVELLAEVVSRERRDRLVGDCGFGTPPSPFGPWQLMQP